MQGIPESVLKDVVRETLVGMKFGSLEKVVFFFLHEVCIFKRISMYDKEFKEK
jgi:hypothetical protein